MSRGKPIQLGVSAGILAALSHGPKYVVDLAREFGVSPPTAYITLERHRLVGRVQRQRMGGSGKAFLYRITEAGRSRLEWLEKSGRYGDHNISGLFLFLRSSVEKYLASVEEIPITDTEEFSMEPGIYFLYEDRKLVYIGKSDKSLFERLLDHRKKNSQYTVRHLPADDSLSGLTLRRVEDWLILAFRPKKNGGGVLW